MAKDLSISVLLDFYGPFLSEKQRNLLHHYYNEDLSLTEIAENEQITRQGVRDLIKRGEAQLKKYEQECGWCQNVLSLQAVLESDKPDTQKLIDIQQIANKF
ncbi:MAG: sigma factor-like helix-turn-helix DNA-binding protein [Clostridia bacterium]|nr:sigma factor-like helix-turn-helix DNA-binding protein [Clostridia bacterium]